MQNLSLNLLFNGLTQGDITCLQTALYSPAGSGILTEVADIVFPKDWGNRASVVQTLREEGTLRETLNDILQGVRDFSALPAVSRFGSVTEGRRRILRILEKAHHPFPISAPHSNAAQAFGFHPIMTPSAGESTLSMAGSLPNGGSLFAEISTPPPAGRSFRAASPSDIDSAVSGNANAEGPLPKLRNSLLGVVAACFQGEAEEMARKREESEKLLLDVEGGKLNLFGNSAVGEAFEAWTEEVGDEGLNERSAKILGKLLGGDETLSLRNFFEVAAIFLAQIFSKFPQELSIKEGDRETLFSTRIVRLLTYAFLHEIPPGHLIDVLMHYPDRNRGGALSAMAQMETYAVLEAALCDEVRKDPAWTRTGEYAEKREILEKIRTGAVEIVVQKGRRTPILNSLNNGENLLHDLFLPPLDDGEAYLETAAFGGSTGGERGASFYWMEAAVRELFGRLRHRLFPPADPSYLPEEMFAALEWIKTLEKRYGTGSEHAFWIRRDELERRRIQESLDRLKTAKIYVGNEEEGGTVPWFPEKFLQRLGEQIRSVSPWSAAYRFSQNPEPEIRSSFLEQAKNIRSLWAVLHVLHETVGAEERDNGVSNGGAKYLFLGDQTAPVPLYFPVEEEALKRFPVEGINILGRVWTPQDTRRLPNLPKDWSSSFQATLLVGNYVVWLYYYRHLRRLGQEREDAGLRRQAEAFLGRLFPKGWIMDGDQTGLLLSCAPGQITLEGKPSLGRCSRQARRYREEIKGLLALRSALSENVTDTDFLEYLPEAIRNIGDRTSADEPALVFGWMLLDATGDIERVFHEVQKVGGRVSHLASLCKWHGDRLMARADWDGAWSAYSNAHDLFRKAGDPFGANIMTTYLAALATLQEHFEKGDTSALQTLFGTQPWPLPIYDKEIRERVLPAILIPAFEKMGLAGEGRLQIQPGLLGRALRLAAFCHLEGIPLEELRPLIENWSGKAVQDNPDFLEEARKIIMNGWGGERETPPTEEELPERAAQFGKHYTIDSLLLHLEVYAILKSQLRRERLQNPTAPASHDYRQRDAMLQKMASGSLEVRVGLPEEMGDAIGRTRSSGGGFVDISLEFSDTQSPFLELLPVHPKTFQNIGDVAVHEIWGHARSITFGMIWGDDVEDELIARISGLRYYYAPRFGAEPALAYACRAMNWGQQWYIGKIGELPSVFSVLSSPARGARMLFPAKILDPLQRELSQSPIGDWLHDIALNPESESEGDYFRVVRKLEAFRYLFEKAHLTCAGGHLQPALERLARAVREGKNHREEVPLFPKGGEEARSVVLETDVEATVRFFEEEGVPLAGKRFSVREPERVGRFLLSGEGKNIPAKHLIQAMSYAAVLYYHYLVNMAAILDDKGLEKKAHQFLREVLLQKYLDESLDRFVRDRRHIHGHYRIRDEDE